MAENAAQQHGLDQAGEAQGDHQGDRGGGGLECFGIIHRLDQQDQAHRQHGLEGDGGDRDPQIAHPRDIDQRRFGHDRGGRHHFRGKEKGERPGPADEIRSDEAHHRFARQAQRQGDTRLHRSDPEAHLTDLLCDLGVVLGLQVLGDDRAEDGLETGLQLLRQARNLLRHVIHPDRGRRGEQAEDEDVDAPRAPFDRIRRRQRQSAHRHPAHCARARSPALRQAVTPQERPQADRETGVDRHEIGEIEPGLLEGGHEIEHPRHDRDRPGFDHGTRPDSGRDVVFIGLRGKDDLGQRIAGDRQHDQQVEPSVLA